MNRQAFRSLTSRSRPELEQSSTIVSTYFRTAFSTTSPLLEPENNNGNSSQQGSLKARTRAVGARVTEMLKSRPVSAQSSASSGGASAGGKVLDVKILPRGGLRGRGGFRGRGGSARAPEGSAPSGNRFAGASQRGGGTFRGRGRGGLVARGGRGGRGGRGAARGGKPRSAAEGEEEKAKLPWRARKGNDGMDLSQRQFDHLMRFGEKTVWTPELTADTLAPYMPSVPSSASAAARAAVLKNLSILAQGTSADFAGQPEIQHGSHTAWELRERGMRFFPDPQAKEEAEASLQEWRTHIRTLDETLEANGEQPIYSKDNHKHLRQLVTADGPILKEAEESVKKAVVDAAVRGAHEKPVFAEDTPGLMKSWGLREGSYTDGDRKKFESKVLTLLAKGQKAAVKPKPKAA